MPDQIKDKQIEICFFTLNLRNKQIECLNGSLGIFGSENGTLSIKDLLNIVHPDDQKFVENEFDKVSSSALLNFDFRILTPDKNVKWFTCRSNTPSDKTNILGVFFDITRNKLTEETLRRIKYTFDHARDTMFWIDENGRIVYVNDTACKVLGYTREELLSMNILDIDPALPKDSWSEHWANTINKKSYVIETLHKTKTGKIFPVEVSITVMTFEGKIYHSSIARDITERKLLEEFIRKSEEKYRNIFNNSPLGIYRTTPDGKIIEANPAILQMLGYSSLKELQQNNLEKTKQFSNKTPRKNFKELIQKNGNVTGYETIWLRKDGSELHIRENAKAVKDSSGEIIFYEGTVEDITAYISAQKKLKDSEKLYRTLAESARYYIYLIDKNFRIRFINSHLAQKINAEPEKIQGLHISEIFPPAQSSYLMSIIERTCRENAVITDDSLVNINEDYMWFSTQFVPLEDDAGDVHSVLCISHDITERKKTELEIIAAKERAEEMNKFKTHFLTNMSHELRTPLFGIIGFSELLQNELHDSEHLEMIKAIFDSAKRLSETLNSILDLSKIEADKIDFKPVEFDLISLYHELLNNYKEVACKKNLYLKKEYAVQKLPVYMDKKALETILLNLLNNAVKFTNRGGVTVAISTEKSENEELILKISDTGIGIAKESFEIIFEEFRQVSEGFNRNFEGSGLGLSIVKKIVEKLDGSVSVESEIGKGSTFTVRIPLQFPENIARVNKSSFSKTALKYKPTILIVDDDENVKQILTTFLSPYYNINYVKKALKAIEKVKEKVFDCIIMDINLGEGMDGISATKEIKKLKEYKSIPIVACTAYALPGDKEEFLSAGCTHYLSKPFRKNELLNLMDEIFSKK